MSAERPDTTVVCSVCGCRQRVRFATALRSGWPKCHGYTMTMKATKADIAAAVGEALRGQMA